MIGHLANPLLVLPLKPAMAADSSSAPKSVEPDRLNKLVGAGYQAFEDSVLMKLQKVSHLLMHFSQTLFPVLSLQIIVLNLSLMTTGV